METDSQHGHSRTPRLFVDAPLAPGDAVTLAREQAHYVQHVMRLKDGDLLRVFNRHGGEWLASILSVAKRGVVIDPREQLRQADTLPDLDYLFAPLKHARLDYMVQKAAEMGVRRLRPVITRRTVAERVNMDRLRANVIEAAEQCNIAAVPDVLDPLPLGRVLADWDPARRLIFADEGHGAEAGGPAAILSRLADGPLALLVGPEGGFAPEEQAELRALAFVTAVPLGPRIMRADTAAVAALALIQALRGDWRS